MYFDLLLNFVVGLQWFLKVIPTSEKIFGLSYFYQLDLDSILKTFAKLPNKGTVIKNILET